MDVSRILPNLFVGPAPKSSRDIICLKQDYEISAILNVQTDEDIPIPPGRGRAGRYDYEYRRNGTANHFMFCQPLGNWRRVSVREQKTAKDWAEEVAKLLDEDFPKVEKVVLVCDNLNTHTIASFYEAFPPRQARAYVERLEIHYTPKHGSWLDAAEIELSVLTKQCLDRRIPNIATLRREVAAWQRGRNASRKGVDWQFTTPKARVKLKRLYPQY
jgi:hypothetical protein